MNYVLYNVWTYLCLLVMGANHPKGERSREDGRRGSTIKASRQASINPADTTDSTTNHENGMIRR